ncbi:hypothetical protein ACR6C2_00765 [Streptomyces sp. INA 01156]
MRIEASLTDYRRLLTWAKRWPQRKWAVENANGLAASRPVAHRPRRERRRYPCRSDQPGARALPRWAAQERPDRRRVAATVACLQGDGRDVEPEDHTTALALLDERRVNLAQARVRTVNQLHALLRDLLPGGARPSCPRTWPPSCCGRSVPPAMSRPSARTSPGTWSPRSGNWTSSSRTMLPGCRASWRHRAAH